MAEFGGFFNSISGDRKYKSEDFAKYFTTFMSTGVNPAIDNLRVYKKNNNTVEVRQGTANINGYLYTNDNLLDKSIEIGTTRIDRVVLKLDIINRTLNIQIKKGSTTSPPNLQRDNKIYELSLAKINVGASDINVVDERDDKNLCGYMSFTGRTDTQEMWNIFNSQWQSKQKLWDDWFKNMQGKSIRGLYIQSQKPDESKVGDVWIQLLE
ncbi:hypothetical protein K5V21_06065 [Clostridium sardiniense]|uniref:Uncharacterized protein n=1 Tax=Clostridium sardiniense TaxID=29369 RepID=A0ABS7KW33_CLOSR|nr:hypothetical protein [Clostridium sardiniense]MBY0755019.1 hypothetical protein [Clostridium sardiniense]MDQ0459127.1 hypothetical protein [Clostridium sardiniense]